MSGVCLPLANGKNLAANIQRKHTCYLRAGDSKGSLQVTPGFERMKYVLLHTNGENCQLFRLKKEGTFQIWTKENLEKYGFSPEHSPYYIVLHFDNKPMEFLQTPQSLKQRMNILIKQGFISLMSLCKKVGADFYRLQQRYRITVLSYYNSVYYKKIGQI